jgi:tetratricopeptide (TPR) repeat protein
MRTLYSILRSPLSALLLGLLTLPLRAQQSDLVRGFDRPDMELYGNDIMRHIVAGDNLVRQARWEDAIRSYDYAIAHNPYFADAYMKRAIAKWRMGRESEAERDYQKAIRLNPFVDDLYGYKGQSGRLQLLAFDASRWIHQVDEAELVAAYRQYARPKVKRVASSEYRKPSQEERAALTETLDLLEAGRWADAAVRIRAIAESSQWAPLLDLKGLLLARQGQLEEALSLHLQAMELDPDYVLAPYNQSVIYNDLGRTDQAMEAVNEALILDPTFHLGYLHRARLLKGIGRPEAALSDYDRLYELGYLNHTGLLLNQAITRKLAGDALGALNDLNRLLEQRDVPEAGLLQLRGNLYLLLGEPLKAADDYSAAIRQDRNLAEAYFNRGLAYLLANVRSNGCYDIEQSVALGYQAGTPVMQYFCGL